MSPRDLLIFGLALLVLVIGIAGANLYLVQPALVPELPKAVIIPPEQTPAPAVDSNIVATTLEKMKSMFPQKESEKDFLPRRVGRNPFLWPGETTEIEKIKRQAFSKGAVSEKKTAEKKAPRLRMVIIGEKRKVALINDSLLHEGDRFNSDTVHRIKQEEVVLKSATGEEIRVPLSGPLFPSPDEEAIAPEKKQTQITTQEEVLKDFPKELIPLIKMMKQGQLSPG